MSLPELFAWPEALPVLLLVPLVWLLLHALDRSRARRLEQRLGPRARLLALDLGEGERRVRRRLSVAGLLLALIALMQPIWGEGMRKAPQRGVDILICLDVSRSMLARDLPPSRLERAQSEILALAGQAGGDRLGLVAFAGDAQLIAPLTLDMESFAELTGMTGPLSIQRGGSDLGAALDTALDKLEGQTGDHEVVVLLTDGEDLEERGLRAAEQCREKNIRVHCVGFGSARGSKIALEGTGGEAFLLDGSGDEVVSAMDASGLRRIAESTGGEFLDAGDRPLPLLELYEKRIQPMARKSFEAASRRERKNRFQWPLLAALLLWFMEFCLTDRKRR
ncbi:MAG: VWA domain-containing protein [Planctomycetota bacterium]|jgi:Ca-activated chloride channel family protein